MQLAPRISIKHSFMILKVAFSLLGLDLIILFSEVCYSKVALDLCEQINDNLMKPWMPVTLILCRDAGKVPNHQRKYCLISCYLPCTYISSYSW